MPTAPLPRLAAVLGATCMIALAACGGDDSGDATEKISSALSTGLTTEDPTVLCTKTYATGFVDRVYGSQAACLKAEKQDAADGEAAQAVEVSGIKVDDGKATAFVEIKGGTQDGSRGALTVVDEDGAWRVSDLSVPLLRSQFEQAAKNDREIPAALKTCLTGKVLALDDAQLKQLAYGSIGDKDAANQQIRTFVADCGTELGDDAGGSSGEASAGTASVLRRQFEQGITESLQKDGIPASAIECVKNELRSAISDDEIVALIGKSSAQVPPDIAADTAAALAKCDATN